jgi:hypothetical protein
MAKSSLHKTTRLIVLLTDFGLTDGYAGVMKGVICGVCRTADIIDLSHNIAPQDVAEAAFVLAASYRYFPAQTIFVTVVDPGVGTERAVLCMRANRQIFLAPDNGILSVIAEETDGAEIREVTAQRYFLKGASATFHGRDIFAPVAAHLAAGLQPSKLGPLVERTRKLKLPKPIRAADGSLRGQIIYVDRFGNLITNIRQATLAGQLNVPLDKTEVRIKRRTIHGVSRSYADRKKGELLALIGSTGYLEVAVNQGSAAQVLACEKGETVALAAFRGRAR